MNAAKGGRNRKKEALFAQDYRVIDVWPRAVSEENGGFFGEVEQFYLQDRQLLQYCERVTAVVLKLLCYYPFEIYVEEYVPLKGQRTGWLKDKSCARIVKLLRRMILKRRGRIDILLAGDAVLSISGGDLSLAVYHEDEALRELLDRLAAAEGLYCWKYRV